MKNNLKKSCDFHKEPRVLCIGGFDPTGGAGITADILSVRGIGVRGFAVPTALTAQNDKGVLGVVSLSSDFFLLQVQSVLKSISIQGIKVGMVYDEKIFDKLLSILKGLSVPVVWDPVMDSSSGYSLMSASLRQRFKEIFPYVTLLTPNIPEAQILTGEPIDSMEDMLYSAKKISDMGCVGVLMKGGHLKEKVCDLLYYKGESLFFEKERKELGRGVHGTGCALSSAVIAHIALGYSVASAVKKSIGWLEDMLNSPQLLEEGGYSFLSL